MVDSVSIISVSDVWLHVCSCAKVTFRFSPPTLTLIFIAAQRSQLVTRVTVCERRFKDEKG